MRVRLSEVLTAQKLDKFLGVPPGHALIVLAFHRLMKVAPPFDDLLGRAAADTPDGNPLGRLKSAQTASYSRGSLYPDPL